MKTRFVMFSMIAAIAIFAANSFAANNNAAAKEVKSEKVDQDVKPKAMMWVGFNNQTGDGNHSGTMQVNVQTMNMTFEALAYEWARAAQVTGTYKNYKYYNSRGQLLDMGRKCTEQGVSSGSTVKVTK